SLFQDDSVEPNEWIITIFVTMEPEYSDIVDLEQWFSRIAEQFNGEYDGWGCMAYVFDEEEDDILQ
ncbi:ribonuclease E inhibitor RraB, partial [Acinetobacter baumannii]